MIKFPLFFTLRVDFFLILFVMWQLRSNYTDYSVFSYKLIVPFVFCEKLHFSIKLPTNLTIVLKCFFFAESCISCSSKDDAKCAQNPEILMSKSCLTNDFSVSCYSRVVGKLYKLWYQYNNNVIYQLQCYNIISI